MGRDHVDREEDQEERVHRGPGALAPPALAGAEGGAAGGLRPGPGGLGEGDPLHQHRRVVGDHQRRRLRHRLLPREAARGHAVELGAHRVQAHERPGVEGEPAAARGARGARPRGHVLPPRLEVAVRSAPGEPRAGDGADPFAPGHPHAEVPEPGLRRAVPGARARSPSAGVRGRGRGDPQGPQGPGRERGHHRPGTTALEVAG
mmetsp:Transcript_27849/g.86713  ORF Transcript_27849/g.86713 Transcript_27849/m.86713 type:complete len:204 (-) Transcript_27849:989-1600(-)